MRPLVWILAAVTATACAAHPSPPRGLADITVTDRTTGETLPVYWHRGERWIEGKPGHRYSVTIQSQHDGRLLTVLSVDGVNAVTGETAAWNQRGYVLGAYEQAEIRGWRKSQQRVAAFEFTALPDSYAARTGRPDQVGVIGIAVFREAPPQSAWWQQPNTLSKAQDKGTPAPAPAAEGDASSAAAARAPSGIARADDRLGTGHGPSEVSRVNLTQFERARTTPDQLVTVRYDSRANLVAMGVIPSQATKPNPFPGSLGFVPDPPLR
jgi:hypothetical protein